MFPILEERRRHHALTLSGGQQQMLAIVKPASLRSLAILPVNSQNYVAFIRHSHIASFRRTAEVGRY